MTDRHKLASIGSSGGEGDEIEEPQTTLPARIFDAHYIGEPIPEGFDAVRIALDGTLRADLGWESARKVALDYVKKGFRILWDIDLGLLASLPHPLSHRSQFLSLSLSLEHFRDTLWKEFRQETVGLCLYRGTADFSLKYPWDDEQRTNLREWLQERFSTIDKLASEIQILVASFQEATPEKLLESSIGKELLQVFCCDAIGEYLHLLSGALPDTLPLFLLLDVSECTDPFTAALLLTKERYPRFHIAAAGKMAEVIGTAEMSWMGKPLPNGLIAREIEACATIEKAQLGVCFPLMSTFKPSQHRELRQQMEALYNQLTPFRVIPESELSREWEGLDQLIVSTHTINTTLKRKLLGFCAAGGRVISLT